MVRSLMEGGSTEQDDYSGFEIFFVSDHGISFMCEKAA